MTRHATLQHPFSLSGIGIHRGEMAHLTFHPAPIGTGIVFQVESAVIPAIVPFSKAQARATLLDYNGVQILTPEHVLSACFGCGLSDVIIHVDGPEIPILDGSALIFCDHIRATGLRYFETLRPTKQIQVPKIVCDGTATVVALPDSDLKFSMIIEYPDHFIGTQSITFNWSQNTYHTDIAPARTYGFKAEIDALLARGLGLGGSLDNALVIGDQEYLSPLRFPDELVRHKLLDLIGDLSLCGHFLQGHFVGIRSGHSLNRCMAEYLYSI